MMTKEKFRQWFDERFLEVHEGDRAETITAHGPFDAKSFEFRDTRATHEGYEAEIKKLERRLKHLEQFHCDHEFSKPDKGCLESLFCAKCGALHPEWEEVPERSESEPLGWHGQWIPPFCDDPTAIQHGGVWYRPKAKKKGRK